MIEVDTEEKIPFHKANIDAMRSLRKAFQLDAEREKKLGDLKESDPTPYKNVRTWLQTGWMYLIVWVIAIGIVWSVITPKKERKRSHHKYDENGRLIY